jgi:hypothetical protein
MLDFLLARWENAAGRHGGGGDGDAGGTALAVDRVAILEALLGEDGGRVVGLAAAEAPFVRARFHGQGLRELGRPRADCWPLLAAP